MTKIRTFVVATWLIGLVAVFTGISHGGKAFAVDFSSGPLPVDQRQVQEITPYEPSHPGQVWLMYSVTGALDQLMGTPPMLWSGGKFCHTSSFACLEGVNQAQAIGYFPLCDGGQPAPCILGIEGRTSKESDWTKGVLKSTISWIATAEQKSGYLSALNSDGWGKPTDIADGNGWPQQPKSALYPSADGPMTFQIPGLFNAGGTDSYLLDSGYVAALDVSNGLVTQVTPQKVHFNVRPFVTGGPDYTPMQALRNGTTGSVGMSSDKAYSSSGSSGWAAAFMPGTEIRLQVRLPKLVSGWFAGRLDAPDISVIPNDDSTNTVTISGGSVEVPTTAVGFPFFSPEAEQIRHDLNVQADQATIEQFKKIEASGGSGATGVTWTPEYGIDRYYTYWSQLFPSAAKGKLSVWSVSTLAVDRTSPRCFQDNSRLQGIVTSNAMAYQAGLPQFTGSSLDYSVAGVHYNADKSLFKGTYRLIMRSDIARCLYGFSNAPIGGTVSVTSADGNEQVAYTNVTDRDGWLTLSAQGFTFSNPTISAKLTQASSGSPTPSPTPSSSSSRNSVKTIVCTKGKLYKRVTGVSPKCPAGYKKKA